jgi:hypothetical protein
MKGGIQSPQATYLWRGLCATASLIGSFKNKSAALHEINPGGGAGVPCCDSEGTQLKGTQWRASSGQIERLPVRTTWGPWPTLLP